ncbi:MAG: 2-hydroxyglutaryl-CoA dehydratase [Deltaproteobacteria bacterium]|nr:MAG: 2-hydroxyglutaryl-CoA dehydratase [Deltaproteobacteria bacterium]
MITAGIDIGSLSTEALIMQDGRILSYAIAKTGPKVKTVVKEVLDETLDMASLSSGGIDYVVATGYGRVALDIADRTVTEITCHATGAYHLFPETRLVIDIGGQDSKVIQLDSRGKVVDFVMNDKCAAGTGRFLEVMADALELGIAEIGPLSLKSRKKVPISSTCTVFAESEVISLIAEGCERRDILRGLHEAIANRIIGMASKLMWTGQVTMTGGVAKNTAIAHILRKKIPLPLNIPEEPQIVGALGAAFVAQKAVATRSMRAMMFSRT